MEFGFPVEAVVILTVAVVASVWLDLFSHRNDEEVTFKNAAIWSVFLGGHGAGANQAQGGGNDDLAHGVSSLFCHGERAQP